MTPLPPISIRSRRWLGPLYLGIAMGAALVTWLLQTVNGESSASVIDAELGYAAVLVVVVGGTLALLLRAQRRHRARLLAAAPTGTVFAAPVRPLEVELADARRRSRRFAGWTAGVLVLGPQGIAFERRKPGQTFDEVHLAWSEIASVDWRRTNPYKGLLSVTTTTRQIYAWEVAAALEDALRRLEEASPLGVDR